MLCPDCGSNNPPIARFCHHCGAALAPRRRIPWALVAAIGTIGLLGTVLALTLVTRTLATTQVRATATSMARTTATAQARATAQAQGTTTAQVQSTTQAHATATFIAHTTSTAQARATAAIKATLAARAVDKSVLVKSDRGWQDTEMYVQKGESLRISYVAGTWTPCYRYGCRNYDARGVPNSYDHSDNIITGCSHAALIARISDDQPFCVGAIYLGQVNRSGSLELRINDNVVNDNAGLIAVRVEVIR